MSDEAWHEELARASAQTDQYIALLRDNPELAELGEQAAEVLARLRLAHLRLGIGQAETSASVNYMLQMIFRAVG